MDQNSYENRRRAFEEEAKRTRMEYLDRRGRRTILWMSLIAVAGIVGLALRLFAWSESGPAPVWVIADV